MPHFQITITYTAVQWNGKEDTCMGGRPGKVVFGSKQWARKSVKGDNEIDGQIGSLKRTICIKLENHITRSPN
jgi:hypothetical protein